MAKITKRYLSRADRERVLRDFPGRSAVRVLRDSVKPASQPNIAYRSSARHTGPNNPDKGMKDGSCNRTACQRPLKGRVQYYMTTPFTAGEKLYYCRDCADSFAHWDRIDRPGEPLRCTLDPDTVATESK